MKLDELIEHYDAEQSRLLGKIEKSDEEGETPNIWRTVIQHPLLAGSVTWLFGNTIMFSGGPLSKDSPQDLFAVPLATDAIMLGIFAANDYQKEKKLSIPTIVAGATGAATALIFSAPLWNSQFYPTLGRPPWELGFSAAGLEILLMKSALSLRSENLSNRKKGSYQRSLVDTILFDWPTLAGIAAVGAGYMLFSSDIYHNVLEGNFSGSARGLTAYYALSTFLAGLGGDVLAQLASKYFDDAQRKRIFRYFIASCESATGRKDAAIRTLQGILNLPLSVSQLARAHYSIGKLYLELDDYGKALAEFDFGIKAAPPGKDLRNELFVKNKKKFYRLTTSKNIDELVRAGITFYSKGLTVQGDFCFVRALYLDPENSVLHWIRADALRLKANYEEEKFERDAFIDLIFSDPDLESKFILQHDSRNEIALYGDENFPAFSVVLKRSRDRESMELEYRTTRHFADVMGGRVIKPLAVREHNGFYYMIMPHAGSRFYEEVRKGNYKTGQFEEGIDFLIDYFVAATNAYKKGIIKADDVTNAEKYRTLEGKEIPNKNSDGTLYFSNRISDIALGYLGSIIKIPADIRKLFEENSWIFNRRLESLEKVVSKDSNIKNFYRTSSGAMIAGDFESLKFIPAYCEISRFLEFGFEFLSKSEKAKLLEHFYDRWSRISENAESEQAMLNYHFASLYDNLILLGYRARDARRASTLEERLQCSGEELFHLNSAKRHIKTILRSNVPETDALEDLNKGIEGVIYALQSEYKSNELRTRPIHRRLSTTIASAGAALAILAASVFFGQRLFKENYTRTVVGISTSALYPEQQETIHIIDTRTGKEIYTFSSFANSFDWNPDKSQLTIATGEDTFVYDLNSRKKISIDFEKGMDYPLWAPKGNYTLLQDSNGIVIYDKDGKRIDIRGSNPEWAPSSSLLAYKSGKTGNPEIAELAGNSIKDTHPGPAISYTELEFSQDSSKIAYIESDGEKYSLHIADSHFGNIEGLLQSERAITNLRWHDNTLFFERQGIYKIEDKKMSSMISGGNMSFEISRNGKSILVNQYDKLYVMDLKTGNEELVAVPENGSIGNAIFTPDGHNVFYTVSLEHGIDAYLFNLKGQRTKLVSSLCSDFQSSDCYVQEMK